MDSRRARLGRARSTARLAFVALLSAVLSAVLTLLAWVVIPNLAGLSTARISSGSMAPTIRPDDVVVFDRLRGVPRLGQVVVVGRPDGLVTHRVERFVEGGLITKGDANAVVDSAPVPLGDVIGVVEYVVPGLPRWRFALLVLATLGLGLGLVAAGTPRRRLSASSGVVRRRAATVTAATAAMVVATASVGLASFNAVATSNANSFSTVLDPPSTVGALDLGLEANGPIYATAVVGNVLYLAGDFTRINGTQVNRLAAIDLVTDSLTSWNPNANGAVLAIRADQGAGLVYVGGSFTTVGGVARNRVAAIDITTGIATAWNPNVNNTVRALMPDAVSQTVVIGGDFTNVGGVVRNRLSSVNMASGSLTAWNPNVNNVVYALSLSATANRVYAGGAFTTVNGAAQNYLAEIDLTTGSPTAWDPNASAAVRALSLDPAGELLYVGGDFTSIGAAARNRLAAVSVVDALANAWDPSASATVHALVVDPPRGLAYAGGAFTNLAGSYRNRYAALSIVTGNPVRHDLSFDGVVSTITLDAVGDRLVVGGSFTAASGIDRSSLAVVTRPSNPAADEPIPSGIDIGTNGTINAVFRSGDTLYLGGDFTYLNGQRRLRLGAINLTTGAVTSWDPAADGTVWSIAVDESNGTIYVGGDFLSIDASYRQRLAAIDATGAPTAWSPGADAAVYAIAPDVAGGVVYVGGAFSRAGSENRTRLARISATTGLATSWAANVSGGSNPGVYALAWDAANGRVVVGGAYTSIGGVARSQLARVSAGGAVDAAWNPNLGGLVRTMALDAAGTVFVGGDFTTVNGGTVRNRAAAFPSGSATATTWNPNVNASVYSLALDSGGAHVVLAGSFTTVGGIARNRLAGTEIATSAVTPWNPNVSTASSIVRAVTSDPAGRVWVGGNFTTVAGATRESLAQISAAPAGTAVLDSLTLTAPNATGIVVASIVVGDTLYLGGTFTYVGGLRRNRAAAVNLTTDTVTTWDPNLNGSVNAVVLDDAGSTVYLGGAFTTVNGGTTRNRLAAFPSASSTTTAWNPNLNNTVTALARAGATLYVGGTFTTVGAVGRNRSAAFDLPSGALGSWNPNVSAGVNVIAPAAAGIYLGGDFTTVGGVGRTRLALVDNSGALLSWNPGANNSVRALSIATDDGVVFVGGAFTQLGGVARNKLGSVSGAGTVTSWNPGLPSTAGVDVFALRLDGDIVYAGGAFTTVDAGALTRNRIAAWSRASGALVDWSPNLSGTVYSLAPGIASLAVAGGFTASDLYATGSWTRFAGVPAVQAPDHRIAARLFTGAAAVNVHVIAHDGNVAFVGGDFVAAAGLPRRRIVAIDLVTNAVLPWSPGTDAAVRAIAVDANVVYVGGDFTVVNGSTVRTRLAAFDRNTGAATAFAPAANGIVRALQLDSSNGLLYVGGDFNGPGALGGGLRNRLGAVVTATGAVAAFDPNLNGVVRSIAIDNGGSTILAGGDFTAAAAGTVLRNRVAAFTAAGVSTAFDPNANGIVRAVAVDAAEGTVVVGGDFTTLNGATVRNRLAAASLATSMVTAWNPNANSTVHTIVLEPGSDRVYVGGAFTTIGGATRGRVAAIDAASGTAASWNPNANGAINALAVDVTGKRVLIGGGFTTVAGAPRVALARY